MKTMLGFKKGRRMRKIGVFLVLLALVAGMGGCGTTDPVPTEYTLIIVSTEGGTVTTPEEGTHTHPRGALVLLVAEPDEGYRFANWTGNVETINDVSAATTAITMNGNYMIIANFSRGQAVRDWHDLDAIRDNTDGHYVLMNELDLTTDGYAELAGPTANGGKGWEPIGYVYWDYDAGQQVEDMFKGTFDGQGYEIRDLCVNRPDEEGVGLFGYVGEGGIVKDVGLVDVDVTGGHEVGALAGFSEGGTVINSYSSGSVTGWGLVGGLVGFSHDAAVSNSRSTCIVTGEWGVGGLVGLSGYSTISDSYSTGSVTGVESSGGLVGESWEGTITDSYATGSVNGEWGVGGLVGYGGESALTNCYATGSVTGQGLVGGLVGACSYGTIADSYSTGGVTGVEHIGGIAGDLWRSTIANSYYNYDEVLINGENVITLGALFGEDFDEWLDNGKSLDVGDRLTEQDGYYLINDVADLKQLLAFGYDASLRFRLTDDLDLSTQPDFLIPYLAGEFDGDGHRISNVSFTFDFVSHVGLFGYLASGAEVSDLGAENVNMIGQWAVGGLVGSSDGGAISSSHSTGTVSGRGSVGGLVGYIEEGSVADSYSECSVTGGSSVGGLVGSSGQSTVAESHATGSVTGEWSVGGLVGSNDWQSSVAGSYSTGSVTGSWSVGGLVGSNSWQSSIAGSYSTGSVTGNTRVGGLTGSNSGTVGNCYSAGNVTGEERVGGLIGQNSSNGIVHDSYSTGTVTRTSGGYTSLGGFIGTNYRGKIVNCYSTGSVHYEGEEDPTDKGFAGSVDTGGNYEMTGNFWDTETSVQISTAGEATGKTTAEMQALATFEGEGWGIVAVGEADQRNTGFVWNIVNGGTYPFLSWQPIG